jgi:hypothetical protein
MNESMQSAPILTVEEAERGIRAILQEVALMGANNSEFGDFETLIEKLKTGEVEPVAAIEQAHLIKSSKMDYH